jgi:hypothetical protein
MIVVAELNVGLLYSVLGNYLGKSCGRKSIAVDTLKGSGIDRNPLATFGTTISPGTARGISTSSMQPPGREIELAAGTDRTARCDDATLRTQARGAGRALESSGILGGIRIAGREPNEHCTAGYPVEGAQTATIWHPQTPD